MQAAILSSDQAVAFLVTASDPVVAFAKMKPQLAKAVIDQVRSQMKDKGIAIEI